MRDVGVEYAHKLQNAGVDVQWHHFDRVTHGWLQMTAWLRIKKRCSTLVLQVLKTGSTLPAFNASTATSHHLGRTWINLVVRIDIVHP